MEKCDDFPILTLATNGHLDLVTIKIIVLDAFYLKLIVQCFQSQTDCVQLTDSNQLITNTLCGTGTLNKPT